jgi:excisionase family DNA binding protein
MTTEESLPRSQILRQALNRSNDKEAEHVLTVQQACRRLQISKWSLYRQFQSGMLASVKIGRRRLIPVEEIEKFLERLKAEGG